MAKKNRLVFDFDDTLADGQVFCGQTMAQTVIFFESQIDPRSIIRHHYSERGRSIVELYRSAIKKFNLKTPIDELLQKDAEIMAGQYRRISLFEGAKDSLQFLKEKDKFLYICTNRSLKSLIPLLKHHQVWGFFDEVISCLDEGFAKPHPKCLIKLIKKTNQNKKSFLYLGDSQKDQLFAQNAGVDFLIFNQYQNGKKFFVNFSRAFLG
ncbi:MAG: HAD hydrolase-like protein [Candidatus Pacebacteria bacterium]|nr:HAD hydrolase-like protein [Candidatus Paceibacterota bacterium]